MTPCGRENIYIAILGDMDSINPLPSHMITGKRKTYAQEIAFMASAFNTAASTDFW